MATELSLSVDRFEGPGRWRWLLTGPGGEFVADHTVRLDDTCWQFEAFTDLSRYLHLHAAPDRRTSHETEIVAGVGRWIGDEVFGAVGAALVKHAPVTVRVHVPESAAAVAYLPLELARIGGRPLALHRVGLIHQIGAAPARPKVPVTGRLRVLGLFSLPYGTTALNLRRERHTLTRLMEDLATAHHRAIELRVLQYGVTRARLRELVEEGEGWDVVHISGHGTEGGLLLEGEDGTADLVSGGELVDLLEPAAERVKLITVSSCLSAAWSAAEHLRTLGLPAPARTGEEPSPVWEGDGRGAPALAAELAGRLDAAVLGMRFPVVDDFAIALAGELYELLVGKAQSFARAVGLALPKAVADPPTPACPALSAGTPAMFGSRAADLVIHAPRGEPVRFDDELLGRIAGLPRQAERFVGRDGLMARASAALAPRSGASGVLLHGMAGVGKTACAMELAHTHHDTFRVVVWYRAPDEGHDISGALTSLALDLEAGLPGLSLVQHLNDTARLTRYLPRLAAFGERERVLVVLDNVESLLTEDGRWRDDRWGPLLTALTEGRQARLILTSRRPVAGLGPRMRTEPVHALSAAEAVLLARELPHLRTLVDATAPGVDADTARRLAVRVLTAVRGHPKLLELTDAQAADPAGLRERLETRLDEADRVWRDGGSLPRDFFTTGSPTASADDYLQVLDAWTRGTADGLPAPAATMFGLLCAMEHHDRLPEVIDAIWDAVWRLHRQDAAPAPGEALGVLTSQALIASVRDRAGAVVAYRMHPAIAAAGRAHSGTAFQAAADHTLAAFWRNGLAAGGSGDERILVHAGQRIVPYLLRLGEWRDALLVLSMLAERDVSRATAAALLPTFRAVAASVAGTDDDLEAERLVAAALAKFDPVASERSVRDLLATAVGREDEWQAFTLTRDLIHHCFSAGRLDEALALADGQLARVRRAGFGPWTEIACQSTRLDVLITRGQLEQALTEARLLSERVDGPPENDGRPEAVAWAAAREGVYSTRREAALHLERWEEALAMGQAIRESLRRRQAHESRVAHGQLQDVTPLVRLDRAEEALDVLASCRAVFERDHDVAGLAKLFATHAMVEDTRGHGERAVDLQCEALRYAYAGRNVENVAVTHHNLGEYLFRHTDRIGQARAHYLAAALIARLIGSRVRDAPVARAAFGLLRLHDLAEVPAGTDELAEVTGQTDGARLGDLVAELEPDPLTRENAFDRVVHDSLSAASAIFFPGDGGDAFLAQCLTSWDPVISGVLASHTGDTRAHAELEKPFIFTGISPSRATLGAVLRRLRDRDPDTAVPEGMDPVVTAVARRALGALAGRVAIPRELWQIMRFRDVLGVIVGSAVRGRQDEACELAGVFATKVEQAPGLAGPLQALLTGDRDAALGGDHDPVSRAVLATVATHLSWFA